MKKQAKYLKGQTVWAKLVRGEWVQGVVSHTYTIRGILNYNLGTDDSILYSGIEESDVRSEEEYAAQILAQ